MNQEKRTKVMENKQKQFKLIYPWHGVIAALIGAGMSLSAQAQPTFHDIAAGNLVVVQNNSGDTAASVTVTMDYAINDLRVRTASNRGDYNLQVGADATDDQPNGLLLSSVSQNGRDNFGTGVKTNAMSAVDYNASGYFVSVFAVQIPTAGANAEYNINVAAAYFPYTTWLGAIARNSANVNGSGTVTNDILVGSPQLQYGVHYIDKSAGAGTNAGKAVVDLRSLGIDSRNDGVLLVNGAKNEDANFALSQVNTTDGTWNLFLRDAGTGGNGENDPMAFLFVPKTNTTVISGRFRGDGSIDMYSGNSPQFTVTSNGVGRYELKIPGRSPRNGVLIISPEGGGAINFDNIVSYETNATADGWIIESRDTPTINSNTPPALESPGALEGVVSFVYVPVHGVILGGITNLSTSESGNTASFTAVLEAPPASPVTIDVSSSNTAEGTVSPSSLSFDSNNWNVPQTVTVTGQDDPDFDGPVNYTIVLAPAVSDDPNYSGLDATDVRIVNFDNEIGIAIVPSSGLITTEAGGTATFIVRLNTPPLNNVTVGFSSSQTNEGTVSPSSLIFTPSNWDQQKVVTITGVNDFVDDGDIAYTIITAPATSSDPSYNNLNPVDVSVVNIDNDTKGFIVTAASLTLVEGKTTNYTVSLTSQPTSPVTVTVSSTDTLQGATVSPSSFTFVATNWNVPKTVTVTAVNDTVPDGNTAFFITNSISTADPLYAAIAPVTISATTLDNEAVVTLPSGDSYYGIGQAGVGIDGRATIVDPNSPNYNGGTLSISITNGATADDRLEIRNTGTAAGQIGISGSNVTYGGVTIGSFSGGTGATPLVVSFNTAGTPAAAEALLRSITFRNINASSSPGSRGISVALVDGDGGASRASTRVVIRFLRGIDFQEGADHGYGIYNGEADIHVRQNSPTNAFPQGGGTQLFIDYPDANNAYHVLLRFDNIYGSGPGRIPTNAIIVSADLVLNFSDSGGGSPLYRMIKAWNATNETWASLTNGVDLDDIDARSSYDSQIAVGAAGTTGLGVGAVSVLPDLVAWQRGETNNGWAMVGWVGKTDGTGFSSSEAANIDDRPKLRVTWLPAGISAATFRYGVNGYTNAVDTFIQTTTPTNSYASTVTMFSDWMASTNADDNTQVLFRFDNIIGSSSNQIPAGATVQAAMLDLASVGGQAMGDGGQFFPLLQPWDPATTTWNSWTNGIQNDGIDAAVAATAVAGNVTLSPQFQGGFHSFDLTPDVQNWVRGTSPNYGWCILPWFNGTDGWSVNSAEATIERERPQLRVYYVANSSVKIGSIARTSNTVTIQFVGAANVTYSVQRALALGGSWSPIGTATAASNGAATFTDNASPATAAFYRIAP
jgi:hypothetical protein